MIRTIGATLLFTVAMAMPAQQTAAQDILGGALLGGAAGALIGGLLNGLTGFGTGLTALPLWLQVLEPAVAAKLVSVA